MRKRAVLWGGLAIMLAILSWLAWPSVALWNADRLGSNLAAANAAKGEFQFIKGSSATSSRSHFYPGTKDCLLPEPDVMVTDWVFGPGELEQAEKEDAFAIAHNRYVIDHFPKQASALCRRKGNDS